MAIVSTEDVLLQLGISSTASAEETAIVVNTIKAAEGAVITFLRYDPTYGTRTQLLPLSDKSKHTVSQVWESYDDQAVLRNYGYGWTNELQVQGIPIRSITSLYLDYDGRNDTRTGAFGVDTLKTEGTDYWANYDGTDSSGNKICKDGILRSQGTWPESPGCVKVTYVSGYTEDELQGNDSVVNARQIYTAILTEATRRAKRTFLMQKSGTLGWLSGHLTSERLGDYSYSVGGTAHLIKNAFGYDNDLMPSTRHSLLEFVNVGWVLNS